MPQIPAGGQLAEVWGKAKGDLAESNYLAAHMHWYNRMKKFRHDSGIDAGRMAELEKEFKVFRNKATRRKMYGGNRRDYEIYDLVG